VPARGSREFTASVRSSGRCQEARWLNDAKHSGVVVVKGAEEEKGLLHGGAPFIAGGGGWQRQRKLRLRRWQR
jgi:hypothetical protein